ncbi:hypothetical protein DSAG12_03082 [Promethearchaeum syntrophicum]|uniref:Chromosome partition protein Smc n=1 Tax=Promethearchaeum syntrophicum TaxID=2594042 RepID=A0A5B9DEM5_9ARCH|nr:hypothetical protein [Candidatus Prometheoarchaeum syntrophicum]QEE17250.1 hypothetical protein DSAG12_03082 [Candidatus Prometheoarchaeum syntrophicum]
MGENQKTFEEKIDSFGNILQKFGLELIQSIGEMKHTLNILTEKIDKVEKEIINIKSLKNQLQEENKFKSEILAEMGQVKSMGNILTSKLEELSSKGILTMSNKKTFENPQQILELCQEKISKKNLSLHELSQVIKEAKEDLFVLTGGHKILFELGSFERKIKPDSEFSEKEKEEFILDLLKKIKEWKKKFD